MRSRRIFQGLMVGAAAAALLVAGCDKDSDESSGEGEKEAEESAEDEGEDKAGAESDSSETASASASAMPDSVEYAAFPADSEMLFGVSFGPVRDSTLWQNYKDMVLSNLDGAGELEKAKEACGFDPLSKLEGAMFGGTTGEDDRMVVVVHGLSRDEIKTCGEGAAEIEDEDFSATDEGKLTKYSTGEEEMWVAWLDDRTLMTGPRAETDKEWIESRAAGEDGMAEDSELVELVNSDVDRGAGVWFGMIPGDDTPMGSGMAMGGGPQPEAIYGSVAPTDGLAIAAGLRFASGDEAKKVLDETKQMLQMVKMQLGDLAKFVDKTEMSVEDSDMLVNLSLTEEELGELVEGVGKMMGNMMGGAMGGGGMGGGGMPH